MRNEVPPPNPNKCAGPHNKDPTHHPNHLPAQDPFMGIRPAVPPTAASENPTESTHAVCMDIRPRGRGGGRVVNGNTNRPADPALGGAAVGSVDDVE